MATITLRLDDSTRAELDELAEAKGVTVSELLRDTIDGLLGRGVEMERTDVPHSINMAQRRILALQHEILRRLVDDDHDARDHQRQIDVLNGGYTGEYSSEFAAIEPELSRADCELVWDILDMFRVFKASVARLDAAEVTALGDSVEYALTFRGFDLNDSFESRLLGYAQHLIEAGKWEELADRFDDAHERGNSHSRLLPTYQRMLAAFTPIWKRKITGRGHSWLHLTADELRTILDAWPYPRD